MSTETKGEKTVGCLLLLISMFASAPLKAWVLIRVYDWHVRPIFGGPQWHILQVWGLMMFVGLLTYNGSVSSGKKKDMEILDSGAQALGMEILYPLLCLFIAWCLK